MTQLATENEIATLSGGRHQKNGIRSAVCSGYWRRRGLVAVEFLRSASCPTESASCILGVHLRDAPPPPQNKPIDVAGAHSFSVSRVRGHSKTQSTCPHPPFHWVLVKGMSVVRAKDPDWNKGRRLISHVEARCGVATTQPSPHALYCQ